MPREAAAWESVLSRAQVERMPALHDGSGSTDAQPDPADGAPESAVKRQREAERWAALLASAPVQRMPELSLPVAAPPPVAWQASDGFMTQAARPTVAGDPAGAIQRLRFDVDAGELGRISVVVDRQGSALRVLVGTDNPAALSQLGPERAALEHALRASGIELSTVRIVRAGELGTVLAQRLAKPASTGGSETDVWELPFDARRRRARRLSLKG
jgi:hypothetical protein